MTDSEYWECAGQLKERLYRIALLSLSSETAAIDAVDEAIFKGYRGHAKLRQPQYFNTWLTRILIRVVQDEMRRRKREFAAEELPEPTQEYFDSLPLKEAIRRLPESLRNVIILRFFNDLTLEETSAVLEIPRGTVATRQRKALSLLKLELNDPEEGENL